MASTTIRVTQLWSTGARFWSSARRVFIAIRFCTNFFKPNSPSKRQLKYADQRAQPGAGGNPGGEVHRENLHPVRSRRSRDRAHTGGGGTGGNCERCNRSRTLSPDGAERRAFIPLA